MRINHPRRSGFYRQAGPVILFASMSAVACSDSTSPRDTTFDNPAGTYQASMIAVAGAGEGRRQRDAEVDSRRIFCG